MIVVMAGLPGTGKSTLARALADRIGALVVSKDEIRAAAFGSFVDYSEAQDDFCMELVYQVARFVADRPVIVDGRTFSKRRHVERMLEALGDVRVIECVCSDEAARRRLAADLDHPAGNRTYAMYQAVKSRAEALTISRLTVDTESPDALQRALDYLAIPTTFRPARGEPSPRRD